MSIRELVRYSRKLLRGRRTVTALVCLMPLAVVVSFRLAEACFYSLMLYFGGAPPLELFTGTDPVRLSVTAGAAAARWLAAAPLSYMSAQRLCELCDESRSSFTPLTGILVSRRCVQRSLAALLWTKSAEMLLLAPAAFFGITAYSLFVSSKDAAGMFMTVHAISLTAVSLGIWLSAKLTFAAVPYLLAEFPEMSAFRAVLFSIRFMRGRKNILLRLIMLYLPAMLPAVTVPFVLPELKTAFALSIHIGVKEEEYLEGAEIHRHRRRTNAAAKLSAEQKRRFKTASD